MIRVLARHCNNRNTPKNRPVWFDYERTFCNLMQTMDEDCSLTVLFDGDPTQHFVSRYPVNVVRFDGGSDAASFAKVMNYCKQQREVWHVSDIVYLLEDDYVHRPGWPDVMREGFHCGLGDMLSLYDHTDRYTSPETCRIACTARCHWRTAPSTTNTFALRFQTLLEDLDVHSSFAASGVAMGHHSDHEKHVYLQQNRQRVLITSVPGFSAHCETGYLSPTIDWSTLHQSSMTMTVGA